MNQSILIADGEPGFVAALGERLRFEGYRVESACDGSDALQRAAGEPFDLLLMDAVLPLRSGLEVCRELRRMGFATPIMMLTARRELVDIVVGLKLGADDYLTKPFEMPELLARLEALLRRASATARPSPVCRVGSATVDLRKTIVSRDGQPVLLSAREFQLLRYFIEHRGETLTRAELLREVWGYAGDPSTRTVDVHVSGLRQKLEPNPKDPRVILTAPGLGYKLAE
jgi:two-component system, OmpR family, alkaline phosphatase synthesis response regulator PhoP